MRKKCYSTLINLLRAKDNMVIVKTYEEAEFVKEVCSAIHSLKTSDPNKFPDTVYVYSTGRGLYKLDILNPDHYDPAKVEKNVKNFSQLLEFIDNYQHSSGNGNAQGLAALCANNGVMPVASGCNNSPAIFIAKDMHVMFNDKNLVRKLRDLKENYADKGLPYCPLFITTPVVELPCEIEKLVTYFEFELLSKEEIREYVSPLVKDVYKTKSTAEVNELIDKITNSAVGLTLREITRAIMHSLAKYDKEAIEPADIYEEKLQVIKKSAALDMVEPTHTLDDLGGCAAFKEYIKKTKEALCPEAREFGLPMPKGCMLVGVPGTSKSVSAEIMASYLGVPLLSLDMAKVMGSFVGQSERAISSALSIAKAVAPCVLLLDECEKVLGGVSSSNSSDSGTLARVMSQILTFLQEENSGVITVMTSNDVSQLPPELTRSGRLDGDGQWMFDLPNEEERLEIAKIYINKSKLTVSSDVMDFIVKNSENFTGAEIKGAVKSMMINSFYRQTNNNSRKMNRIITEDDAKSALDNTVTVWKSSHEKIEAFRAFARGRYLNASAPVIKQPRVPVMNKKKPKGPLPALFKPIKHD